MELKNYMAKHGEVPSGTLTVYKGLGINGIISELTQSIARRRTSLKLPDLSVDEDTLNEIMKLTELTGWNKIIATAEMPENSPEKAEDS